MNDGALIDWKADTWEKDINWKLHNENHRRSLTFLIFVLVRVVTRRADQATRSFVARRAPRWRLKCIAVGSVRYDC
jgi:hypothetical protein